MQSSGIKYGGFKRGLQLRYGGCGPSGTRILRYIGVLCFFLNMYIFSSIYIHFSFYLSTSVVLFIRIFVSLFIHFTSFSFFVLKFTSKNIVFACHPISKRNRSTNLRLKKGKKKKEKEETIIYLQYIYIHINEAVGRLYIYLSVLRVSHEGELSFFLQQSQWSK